MENCSRVSVTLTEKFESIRSTIISANKPQIDHVSEIKNLKTRLT